MPRAKKRPKHRLDELGYLEEDPEDRGCFLAMWVESPTGTEELIDYSDDEKGQTWTATIYDALDYNGVIIKVGTVVFLTPETKGELCEIGRVVKLFGVDDEYAPKRMNVQWFFRPEHIDLNSVGLSAAKYEIFLSPAIEEFNSVDAIEK